MTFAFAFNNGIDYTFRPCDNFSFMACIVYAVRRQQTKKVE